MAKKILLADDSITIQKVISITFASEDYELVVVGDGDSAITKAKDVKPDLVMADVAMPGKNGYEVCEAIKNDAALGATPVLLLAGTFEPLNKAEADRVKADDSIVKPFESQELVEKVKELLKKAETTAKPRVQEAAAATGKSLDVSEDIWEAGDFLGFSEDPAAKADFKEGAPDLGFLEGGLFEPAKDEHLTDDHSFVDLDFKEEESKPAEAKGTKAHDFELETFDRGFNAPAEKKTEPKKTEEDAFSFDPSAFDSFKSEPVKTEPFEVGPFDVEAFKEPAKDDFWATPASGKNEPEPDIIEMPEEVIAEPQKEARETQEPVFASEPEKPVAPVFDLRPEPARETISAEAVAVASEAEVSKVIEKAAAKVEQRIREVSQTLEKAEAQINRAIQSVQSMAEENLKTGLNASFQKADVQIAKMMETVSTRAEQKVREEMNARLEKLAPPRAAVEDIIKKSTKEIVEQVVWEVVPELAENIIKAEIAKFKEAIAKLK